MYAFIVPTNLAISSGGGIKFALISDNKIYSVNSKDPSDHFLLAQKSKVKIAKVAIIGLLYSLRTARTLAWEWAY
jgi:hypothetical protein